MSRKASYQNLVKDVLTYLENEYSKDEVILSHDTQKIPRRVSPKKEEKKESSSELKALVSKIAPYVTLVDTPPDDTQAKKISERWKEQVPAADVILLFSQESHQELNFLKNLAKAIHVSLASAKIIDSARLEQEKKWDLFLTTNSFKLILASKTLITKLAELKRYYKEIPSKGQFYLHSTPFLPLESYSSYFKTPMLKRTLWQTLCQLLKT